jgi:predicted small integral membrane protein
MLKNINKPVAEFEKAKRWVYLACGWGIIIWGLGFFEIGGDWFLSWQNNNLGSFQQGGLNYALEVFIAFGYLRLIRN